MRILPEDALHILNTGVIRLGLDDSDDTVAQLAGPLQVLFVRYVEAAQRHGCGQLRSKSIDERGYVGVIRELLAELSDVAKQVREAVLQVTGGHVAACIAIHNQDPRKRLTSAGTFDDRVTRNRKMLSCVEANSHA